MKNQTTAGQMTVSFSHTPGVWSGHKTIDIEPNATKFKLYKVNFSDNEQWNDQIQQFKIAFPSDVTTGTVLIDSISFEEDEAIYPYAGEVTSIRFDREKGKIAVKGYISEDVLKANAGGRIAFYAVYLPDPDEIVQTAKPLHTVDLSTLKAVAGKADFSVSGVNFMKTATKTLLDADILAVVVNGERFTKIDKRKSAENWRELIDGKYLFDNPDTVFNVTDYGAKGDGFTDDTDAIQDAVDAAWKAGGGKVLLSGQKTYIATNIRLKDHITFFIEKGSVLRRSSELRHYRYPLELGHFSQMLSHINWATCDQAFNFPLLQADGVVNVKVTGGGQIRMPDDDNLSDSFLSKLEHHPTGQMDDVSYQFHVCGRRLHTLPIGFFDVKGIEISDIEIIRGGSFQIAVYFCKNVTIANVREHEMRCIGCSAVSSCMAKNAVIFGLKFMGNDDGIELGVTFHEPRGTLWYHPMPGRDQSVRKIEVYSSYFASSAAGRAICFLTWGSNAPDLETTMIQGITVKDCTLVGEYTAKNFRNRPRQEKAGSIGTWEDNPYNGKYPFNGSETNDYSCIQDVTILNNVYLDKCSLHDAIATNCVTDCGIKSARDFVNRDFANGLTYWSRKGKVRVMINDKPKTAEIKPEDDGAELFQGLHLESDEYQFSANVKAPKGCVLFVRNALTGTVMSEKPVNTSDFQVQTLRTTITVPGTYQIGVRVESPSNAVYFNTPLLTAVQ